ncbi:MAG TPA: signal peptidase I [Candidatus Paceibacterota bacterium]
MEDAELENKKNNGGFLDFVIEVIKFVVLAVVIVVPIRAYVAQPYIVSGSSMFPTFKNGEYLIVDQLTYRFQEPERGDVIVFRFPNNPSQFFIKRVIGLPGETVRLENGKLFIAHGEGDARTENTVAEPYAGPGGFESKTLALGEKEYFVMGDNRSASLDSRSWGALSRDLIRGRAIVRLFPITTTSLFPGKAEFPNE